MATVTQLGEFADILDARTSAEYADDHIPGAINLPVFSNAERAQVGTLYKTDPFAARRLGAALFSANLAAHLHADLARRPPEWAPLVYCARGGQRSGGVVEVMRRIGWRAQQLDGGYKAYRNLVLAQTTELARRLRWHVIAGKTGTGKTKLLGALTAAGAQTLDLEAAAAHRGSVFGDTQQPQPSQRAFETRLHAAMARLRPDAPVFIEAESRKIGALHLPAALLAAMRAAPATLLTAALPQRAAFILQEYRDFCEDADKFSATAQKLAPHAGQKRVAHWQHLHKTGDWQRLVADLLDNFYDLGYAKSLAANYAAAAQTPPLRLDPTAPATLQSAAATLIRLAATN